MNNNKKNWKELGKLKTSAAYGVTHFGRQKIKFRQS
jgi:N-acetylneuraminic acid mutarotase